MSTPTSSSIPPQSPSSAVPANVVIEHDALPIGTRFGEFEVLRVVGVGGFGIVYLAQDHSLERQVALKEYMPAALAARSDGSHITVRSAAFAETYAIGLRSFVNEARLLARFDHPSLVKVYRFWEDNGTAYMVMPFLRGMTLRDARRGMDRAPDEAWIRGVIDPLLGALELLHREGVFHRDIAPDNILLPPSGPPILLDFGAARHVISDRTQSLTAILKPSYAPIEQYAEMSSMRQGPWTDIYALGAVMHYLLFGMPPAPATARAVQPDAEPVAQRQVPGISPNMLAAVGWTLGVRPLERPQSIAVLRDALNGVVAIPEPRQGGVVEAPVAVATPAATPAPAAAGPAVPPSTGGSAAPATVFPTTQRIAVPPRSASDLTRLDAAHEPQQRTPRPVADESEATIVRPSTLPPGGAPAVGLPLPVRPAAAATVTAPATVSPAPAPAAPARKGWQVAGFGAAVVVAAVVLWQFISLLAMPRGTPAAPGAAASTSIAAASTPPASAQSTPPPVATTAPSSTSAAASESPAPVVTVAPVTTATAPTPMTDGARESRPVPAAPNASAPTTATTLGAAASAPARARPTGRPVPSLREGSETYAGTVPPATTAVPGSDDEARQRAQAARDAGYARSGPAGASSSPVPTFVHSGPHSASEACGKRVFIARAICMDRECERPLFRDQPDCKRVLEMKRQREPQ